MALLQLSLLWSTLALQIPCCRLLGFFSGRGEWNPIHWALPRPLPRWGRKVWCVLGSGRQHQAGQGEGEGGDLLLPEQVPTVPIHLLIYLSDQDKKGKTRSGGQPGAVQTGVQPGGGGPCVWGQLSEPGSAEELCLPGPH